MNKYRAPRHKKTICPTCGGIMDIRAKQCRSCWTESKTPLPRTSICPKCGEPKTNKGTNCYRCGHTKTNEPELLKGVKKTKFVPLKPPSHKWLWQFTGFFMGDGCVTGSGKGSRLVLAINQRADSRILMEDIVEKLGGSLYEYEVTQTTAKSKRQCRWSITGFSRCLPVINMMLDHVVLPARKVKELKLAKEWCEWRLNYSSFLGEEGHCITQDYANRLSEIKVFKVHLG